MNKPNHQRIFVCLCGPAGGGKTVLGEKLIAAFEGSLKRSISFTTRAPREGEVNGKCYHFVSEPEFKRMQEAGKFLEWEKVHGNFYGTPILEFDQGHSDLLLIIDIKGCVSIKRKYPDNSVIAFVLPPTFSVLKERLLGRGDASNDEAVRLETARSEYQKVSQLHGDANLIDYLVVNDQLENTYESLVCMIKAERMKFRRVNSDYAKKILSPQ